MKRLIVIALVLVGLVGCSVANHPWENPVPSEFDEYLDDLIVKGWKLFGEWNFEGAYAKFDSVMMMDAEKPDGYIGRGFCNVNLGASDPTSYDEADADFGFVLSINEGGNPIDSVVDIPAIYDSMDANNYYVHVDTLLPMLMVAGGKITIGHNSTDLTFAEFGDNWIKFNVVTDDFAGGSGNPFVPDDTTFFYVNFYYAKDTSIETISAVAIVGLAQLNQVKFIKKGKVHYLMRSVAYANFVKHFAKRFEASLPDYFYGGINSKNTKILLAQDFFLYELYPNCETEILELDSSYAFDRTADNYIQQLQQALQSLYEGN